MNYTLSSSSNEDNDLEDIDLPPLNGRTSFDDYFNSGNNTEYYVSQNSVIFNDISYNTNIGEIQDSKDDVDEICNKSTETEKSVEISHFEDNKSMMEVKCSFCQKKSIMRNMFKFLDDKYEIKENLICLKCSSNICDSRMLKDWDKTPSSTKIKVCRRCRKEKAVYRFNKGNKYCDYCLLKKKWSRLRSRIEFENSRCETSEEDDSNDENTLKANKKQYVDCCFCNERIKINECFKYCECPDNLYSFKYICLICSLNINDWRCLRDWEEESEVIRGRLCSRCKKMKSGNRFKEGKSGCEYCSLKRKRMYLMKRK